MCKAYFSKESSLLDHIHFKFDIDSSCDNRHFDSTYYFSFFFWIEGIFEITVMFLRIEKRRKKKEVK